jgi:hypothetical protein
MKSRSDIKDVAAANNARESCNSSMLKTRTDPKEGYMVVAEQGAEVDLSTQNSVTLSNARYNPDLVVTRILNVRQFNSAK